MKLTKILTATAIANLTFVALIANINTKSSKVTLQSDKHEVNQVKVTPTPVTIVKKVIKKVYVTPLPKTAEAKTSQTVLSTTNTGDSATSNQVVAPITAPATSSTTNNCVITIDGTSYDITSFRSIHSGGDVFNCGSDVSSLFWSRHGSKQLSQLQKYRI